MSGGVLRVLTPGASSQLELVLRPGELVEPLALGSEAEWRLRGLGVRATHAWLRFDGSRLELTASERSSIVLVDGRPLALGWAPIARACRIELGTVALSFEPIAHDVERESSAGHAVSVISHPKPSRRPAVSATAILLAAIVVMAAAVLYLAIHSSHRGPAVEPEILATAAPAVSAAPVASAAAHVDSVVVYPVRHLPAPRSGKSLERLAADAFHAGDHRRAAALYRDLASRQPDNVAFATAADMLEALR